MSVCTLLSEFIRAALLFPLTLTFTLSLSQMSSLGPCGCFRRFLQAWVDGQACPPVSPRRW